MLVTTTNRSCWWPSLFVIFFLSSSSSFTSSLSNRVVAVRWLSIQLITTNKKKIHWEGGCKTLAVHQHINQKILEKKTYTNTRNAIGHFKPDANLMSNSHTHTHTQVTCFYQIYLLVDSTFIITKEGEKVFNVFKIFFHYISFYFKSLSIDFSFKLMVSFETKNIRYFVIHYTQR